MLSYIAHRFKCNPKHCTNMVSASQSPPPTELVTFWDGLTDRERDVLKLSIDEQSRQVIAERLFVCEETVKSHRKHLLKKWPYHTDPPTDGRILFRQILRLMALYLPQLPG